MKKILIAGIAAVAMAGSMMSCSKSADSESSTLPRGLQDSIATFYGRAYGQNIWNYLNQQQERTGDTIVKKDVLKGVQYILGGESEKDVLLGMQIGMDIKNFIQNSKENGIEITPSMVMNEFKKQLLADSLDEIKSKEDYATFNTLMSRVRNLEAERKRQELAKVEEENGKAGDEFVAEAKKNDSAIRTTASGLSYKIENPGEEPKIGTADRARVKYTGRLVNGEVFDSGTAEFTPTRVVEGFGEGMQMLGKGGKATLYIPGKLGYGSQGAGDKIGPNATLVFDIEILDVTPAETPAKK